MQIKRLGIVSTARSDYGLLLPLMRAVAANPDFTLVTFATGGHFDETQGRTVAYYAHDGLTLDYALPLPTPNNTAHGVINTMSAGMLSFSEAFEQAALDAVVVLGDRYETLVCAVSAFMHRIPIIHLHGGEQTLGALDDGIRHAITQLASVHFTAAQPYADRVIAMGKPRDRVFNVGAIGLDHLQHLPLLNKASWQDVLGVTLKPKTFLVTLHSETVRPEQSIEHVQCLIGALSKFDKVSVIITKGNLDEGSAEINSALEAACEERPDWYCFASLGSQRYLSAMQWCDAVIGNTSSGIIEAPFFKTPTVNIGDRQGGRLRAASVIDVPFDINRIQAGIEQALSPAFVAGLSAMQSPYGAGGVTEKVLEALSALDVQVVNQACFA